MGKVRVPLHGKPQGFTTVDPDATPGAIVGRNLYWSDGRTLVTEADFNPAPTDGADSSGVGGVSQTLWSLILQIPANVTALADASGTGYFVVTGAGTGAMRTIEEVAGETVVADGNGVAGNTSIGLADSGVTPGTYTNATVTVDAKGRVTVAASGQSGAVPYEVADGTFYAVAAGTQALFTIPIDLLGSSYLDISGALVEVN